MEGKLLIVKCGAFGFIGMINVCFIAFFEYKSIKNTINKKIYYLQALFL